MDVQFIVQKPLNVAGVERFMDGVVKNTARVTLNMTSGYFPRLKGDLERGSYAFDVQGGHATYSLGTTVDYGKYVWKMKDVHWTNPSTEPQWYSTIFKNHKEGIISQAINGVNITL